MAADKKKSISNCTLALIVFAVLLVAFIVSALLQLNLYVTLIVLAGLMLVGFFGILPHAFEETE